jgi:hypothetical protein
MASFEVTTEGGAAQHSPSTANGAGAALLEKVCQEDANSVMLCER